MNADRVLGFNRREFAFIGGQMILELGARLGREVGIELGTEHPEWVKPKAGKL